ncbi:hypothetical protein [Photobacterium profundum]|uniref:hypothetical protein n=1 Tax=Photobacterium profundum TaxID=74109 RepID=UPI0012F4982C|nr:hypothetical protein [Photobacterium profundum]
MNKNKLLWIYAGHQGLHWAIVGIAIPVLVLIPKLPQGARFSENLLGSRQGAHL